MANMIFSLDLNKNNAINPIIYGRLTDGNLRKITVNITNNGEPVDLTDWVIRFEGTTGGHAKVFDVMGVNVLDAKNGKFEYTFSKTAFSASGAYKTAYFAIEKDDMRETTNDIKIVVENVADLDAQDAQTVVTELNKTIAMINERYAELNGRVDGYEDDIAELEDWLASRKAEVEDLIDSATENFSEKLTEIQEKLDATNQAIEKGNKTIAYAYSADGTDGFTTTYPNMNLINGSSANSKTGFFKYFDKVENGYGEVTLTSTNGSYQTVLLSGYEIPIREYSVGDVYTMTYEIMFTEWNMPDIIFSDFAFGQRYGGSSVAGAQGTYRPVIWSYLSGANVEMNKWYTITKSFTIPEKADPSVTTRAEMIFGARSKTESTLRTTFRMRKPKLEKGSVATPWMPSASEATNADYPSYIGYSNTVKTNKVASDYKWFPTIDSHKDDKNNPHSVTAEQVNAYTKSEVTALIAQLKLEMNPIGSILTTTNSANPTTYIGGTWERYGKGQVLVGVDEDDDDFSEINKTGGEKEHKLTIDEMPTHSHQIGRWNPAGTGYDQSQRKLASAPNNASGVAGGVDTSGAGGGKAHNNMQPFVAVYMFRRIA